MESGGDWSDGKCSEKFRNAGGLWKLSKAREWSLQKGPGLN